MNADQAEITGQSAAPPRLMSLTPGYDERHHSIYLRHLKDAVTGTQSATITNIALTGSYGIGKSSILEKLAAEFEDTSVQLSLSTLGEDPQDPGDASAGAHRSVSITNRIQKEIVKQLLYRETPTSVRDSRFRRIGRFRFWCQLPGSALIAALLVPFIYVLGLADRFVHFAGATIVPRALAYLAVFCFLTAVVSCIRYVTHNQVLLEKLGAGPATISLSTNSQSYFDQYLDEIVYFFEVSKCTLVIFEDIDRFDEPRVFETLRELNTILNSSKQLAGRRIRFIYAIKDSIFERIETSQQPTEPMTARSALSPRANRTKFFDLVIPVVPFITHRNARDLMTETMATDSGVKRDLIDLAAKHITDMRMIKNIRNEFVVFKEKLGLDSTRLPGLTSDALFALVLYKNAHLADFELVKEGTSHLDDIYLASRQLVDENLRKLRRDAFGLRRRLSRIDSVESRAAALGEALKLYVSRVIRHANLPDLTWDRVELTYSGASISDAELVSANFWRELTASDSSTDLTASLPYAPGQLSFTKSDLREALGDDLDVERWHEVDVKELETKLTEIERKRAFLRSADMHDLYRRQDFKMTVGEESLSFKQLTEIHLPTSLASDLMANGYISRNFTLYVSEYYGVHVSLDAMNYLIHFIQPDIVDTHYSLSPADVESVLQEAGSTVLGDRSMYNISILDHLLGAQSAKCDRILDNLTRWGEAEQEFVSAYVADGKHAGELFRRLSQSWSEVFAVITAQDIDDDTRLKLYDGAFSGANLDNQYDISPDVREYLSRQYAQLSALTSPIDDEFAEATLDVLKRFGIVLPSLIGLDPRIRRGVIDRRAYELSERNLVAALDGNSNLALDVMLDSNVEVYRHALGDLAGYVAIVDESLSTPHTISSSTHFGQIVADVAAASIDDVEGVAQRSSPDCRVADLSDVPEAAWSALARSRRIAPTFTNLRRYTEVYGIDENLAAFLAGVERVDVADEDAQSERHSWAVQLLNASAVVPESRTRVELVSSLNLDEYIDISAIEPENGDFFPLLLMKDVVEDVPEVYAAMQPLAWESREQFIAVSSEFTKYATADLIPAQDVGSIMRSGRLSDAVKRAVLTLLPGMSDSLSASAANAVSGYALDMGIAIPLDALSIIAKSGADPAPIITLLGPHLASITLGALSDLLQSMDSPYSALAVSSGETVTVPTSLDISALLRRLRSLGRIRSYRKQRLGAGTNVKLAADTP
ncbi:MULTISPECIES: hypothetical protein [Mycobacteroides]|uniref:YobI family P-loop NTPase n=1 Tax=Mycobacteroides TaxID=670516 RepID=UPI000715EDB2|nr:MULTISPECIES: hypothetical protein [Mycobacteroides]KRQ26463.1 hypothetical protein AOT86_11695 [Mycobacteroides sp. H072]KRQ32663.1 hypothetical protein AOT84_20965 [Mycobacteroides sp. H002]KRQ54089.1 hypothetical protein AOT85_05465 [Mycobacteroides sp. H054]OHU42873.1 hypothetical protein BKG79_02470 [Mycobacteroides chelonae]